LLYHKLEKILLIIFFIVNKKMKFFIQNNDESKLMNKFNCKTVNTVSTYKHVGVFLYKKSKKVNIW
ncbi:hypothetical protein QMG_3678, partial [Clostridioides difficile DA00256]